MTPSMASDPVMKYMTKEEIQKSIDALKKEMMKAAKDLVFIEAARLRDEIIKLEDLLKTK